MRSEREVWDLRERYREEGRAEVRKEMEAMRYVRLPRCVVVEPGGACACTGDCTVDLTVPGLFDARLRETVLAVRESARRAAFAEARKAVEEVKRYDVYGDVQGCTIGPVEGGEYVRCADIVAALDALATPLDTGTP